MYYLRACWSVDCWFQRPAFPCALPRRAPHYLPRTDLLFVRVLRSRSRSPLRSPRLVASAVPTLPHLLPQLPAAPLPHAPPARAALSALPYPTCLLGPANRASTLLIAYASWLRCLVEPCLAAPCPCPPHTCPRPVIYVVRLPILRCYGAVCCSLPAFGAVYRHSLLPPRCSLVIAVA